VRLRESGAFIVKIANGFTGINNKKFITINATTKSAEFARWENLKIGIRIQGKEIKE